MVMEKLQDEKIQTEALVLDNKVVQWQLFVCKGLLQTALLVCRFIPRPGAATKIQHKYINLKTTHKYTHTKIQHEYINLKTTHN